MLVMLTVGEVGYVGVRYAWLCWVSVTLVELRVGNVGYADDR